MFKPQKKYNPLYDPKTDNLPIDPRVQEEVINTPSEDPTGFSAEDRTFLQTVISKIDSGEIRLFDTSSLINQTAYDAFDHSTRGKVDQNAFNLLADIRQIKKLYDMKHDRSFQIQNLIHHIRMTKERFERDFGNVFII